MKQCPVCNRTYADDTLSYCLDDGSLLAATRDPEATVVMPNVPDSLHPPRRALPPSQSSLTSLRWVLYAAILLLAVVVGGAGVALLYELTRPRLSPSVAGPTETSTPPLSTTSPSRLPNQYPPERPPRVSNPVESQTPRVQNLSGEWNLVNSIEKTSYPSYANLQLGYRLLINQSGTKFTAEGEKVAENGEMMPTTERTPIHVTGYVDGETVGATFVEEGMKRKTSGRFSWKIEADGTRLSGTFVSTAANASGKSIATKE